MCVSLLTIISISSFTSQPRLPYIRYGGELKQRITEELRSTPSQRIDGHDFPGETEPVARPDRRRPPPRGQAAQTPTRTVPPPEQVTMVLL